METNNKDLGKLVVLTSNGEGETPSYDEVAGTKKSNLYKFNNNLMPKWAKGVYHFTINPIGSDKCIVLETHFTRESDSDKCRQVIASQLSRMMRNRKMLKKERKQVRVYFKSL